MVINVSYPQYLSQYHFLDCRARLAPPYLSSQFYRQLHHSYFYKGKNQCFSCGQLDHI